LGTPKPITVVRFRLTPSWRGNDGSWAKITRQPQMVYFWPNTEPVYLYALQKKRFGQFLPKTTINNTTVQPK
jgi:hypothetical protein